MWHPPCIRQNDSERDGRLLQVEVALHQRLHELVEHHESGAGME